MGNCAKKPESATYLTYPSYSNTICLSIAERDANGIEYDSTKVNFQCSSPFKRDFQFVNFAGSVFAISGAILPGEDPKQLVQKEVQDLYYVTKAPDSMLACLFDGHGAHGQAVVHFCADFIEKYFQDHSKAFNANPSSAIQKMAEVCDEQLRKSLDTTFSGTTAVILYLDRFGVCVGNIGDSRAILASSAFQNPRPPPKNKRRNKFVRPVALPQDIEAISLSIDQVPSIQAERERIEAAGGAVGQMKDRMGAKVGPQRVWKANKNYPGLAMSRSLGDEVAKQIGVIASPAIEKHYWTSTSDLFIVMASDGVWDVMDAQEVVDFVEKFRKQSAQSCEGEYPATPSNTMIAQLLAEEARYRWCGVCEDEDVVMDDIAVVVIEPFTNFLIDSGLAQASPDTTILDSSSCDNYS